jgi:hypothetical protein
MQKGQCVSSIDSRAAAQPGLFTCRAGNTPLTDQSCAQTDHACLPGKTLSLLAFFIFQRIFFCAPGNVRV